LVNGVFGDVDEEERQHIGKEQRAGARYVMAQRGRARR
jgi:hypothetical protein